MPTGLSGECNLSLYVTRRTGIVRMSQMQHLACTSRRSTFYPAYHDGIAICQLVCHGAESAALDQQTLMICNLQEQMEENGAA